MKAPDGYPGNGFLCHVAQCVHPECATLTLHYEVSITSMYRTIRDLGWSHWSQAKARRGWRCPTHAAYDPLQHRDRWEVNDQRHEGVVQPACVTYCGELECAALHLVYCGSTGWAKQHMRAGGWSHTRFGWRCPEHKAWWKRDVTKEAS